MIRFGKLNLQFHLRNETDLEGKAFGRYFTIELNLEKNCFGF